MKLKIKLGLAVVAGLTVISLGSLPARAATNPYLTDRTGYVRTKKTMYVGIYQKQRGKYRPVKVKKNTLLAVEATASEWGTNGQVKTKAALTYGVVNYQRAKTYKYQNMASIPFTKANFKRVKLKAPIRTQIFHPGKGFTANADNSAAALTAAFYLTLDNYLQYYDKSAVAKSPYLTGLRWVSSSVVTKPTQSVKVAKVTVKGNTTKIDYNRPIKGLPNHKIGKQRYRLTVVNQRTTGHLGIGPIDDTFSAFASWTNYTVNGRPFHFGEIEYG